MSAWVDPKHCQTNVTLRVDGVKTYTMAELKAGFSFGLAAGPFRLVISSRPWDPANKSVDLWPELKIERRRHQPAATEASSVVLFAKHGYRVEGWLHHGADSISWYDGHMTSEGFARGETLVVDACSEKPLRFTVAEGPKYDISFVIFFRPIAPLKEQVEQVLPVLYAPRLLPPKPFFAAVPLLSSLSSQPPNLAFLLPSSADNPPRQLHTYEDRLVAASSTLAEVFAQPPLDGDVDIAGYSVEDDSDDEDMVVPERIPPVLPAAQAVADGMMAEAEGEAARPAKRARLTADAFARSLTPPPEGRAVGQGSEEEKPEQDGQGEGGEARAPLPSKRFGGRILEIPHCAAATVHALATYYSSPEELAEIVFAPLKILNAETRRAFIEQHKEDKPGYPLPVSPRSLYRLAFRLGLKDFQKQALAQWKEQLTPWLAAKLVIHPDNLHLPEVNKMLLDYVGQHPASVWNSSPWKELAQKDLVGDEEMLFLKAMRVIAKQGKELRTW